VRQLVSEVDRQRRLGGALALLLDPLDGGFVVGEGIDGEDADGIAGGELARAGDGPRRGSWSGFLNVVVVLCISGHGRAMSR